MRSNDISEPGLTPDSEERVQDFWTRHGGPGGRGADKGEIVAGICGWSEVYAADGYTLRCEWSCIGGRQEIQYSEKPPRT